MRDERRELIDAEIMFKEFLHYLRETTTVSEGVLDCFKKQATERILADRRRILEQIEEPLNYPRYGNNEHIISSTLKTIAKLKGEL